MFDLLAKFVIDGNRVVFMAQEILEFWGAQYHTNYREEKGWLDKTERFSILSTVDLVPRVSTIK
jgi:hypothetical protein